MLQNNINFHTISLRQILWKSFASSILNEIMFIFSNVSNIRWREDTVQGVD
jgi:hypothetical protein